MNKFIFKAALLASVAGSTMNVTGPTLPSSPAFEPVSLPLSYPSAQPYFVPPSTIKNAPRSNFGFPANESRVVRIDRSLQLGFGQIALHLIEPYALLEDMFSLSELKSAKTDELLELKAKNKQFSNAMTYLIRTKIEQYEKHLDGNSIDSFYKDEKLSFAGSNFMSFFTSLLNEELKKIFHLNGHIWETTFSELDSRADYSIYVQKINAKILHENYAVEISPNYNHLRFRDTYGPWTVINLLTGEKVDDDERIYWKHAKSQQDARIGTKGNDIAFGQLQLLNLFGVSVPEFKISESYYLMEHGEPKAFVIMRPTIISRLCQQALRKSFDDVLGLRKLRKSKLITKVKDLPRRNLLALIDERIRELVPPNRGDYRLEQAGQIKDVGLVGKAAISLSTPHCLWHDALPSETARASAQNTYLSKMTAAEQRAYLWKTIIDSHYEDELPTAEPSPLNSLHMLRDKEHILNMFSGDNAPFAYDGYVKHTHMYGVAALAQFQAESDSEFSGLFASDFEGILRLSRIKLNGGENQFDPSLAFHVFVDRHPSIALLGMPSVDGQAGNNNFFANPFTNLPGPANIMPANLIDDQFDDAAKSAARTPLTQMINGKLLFALPLDEPASIMVSGEAVALPNVPYELSFEAPLDVVKKYQEVIDASDRIDDFRTIISTFFDVGTVLFDVYARTKDDAIDIWSERWCNEDNSQDYYCTGSMRKFGKKIKIGSVRLQSKFLSAKVADELKARHSSWTTDAGDPF